MRILFCLVLLVSFEFKFLFQILEHTEEYKNESSLMLYCKLCKKVFLRWGLGKGEGGSNFGSPLGFYFY